MGNPIRSLQIRPARSADLSFNMAGIIESRFDKLLGAPVSATPYPYEKLYSEPDQPRLSPSDVIGLVSERQLFSLRNQATIVMLRQAIARRELAMEQRLKPAYRKSIAEATTKRVANLTQYFGDLRTAVNARNAAILEAYNTQEKMRAALNQVRWHAPDIQTETVIKAPLAATASVPVEGVTNVMDGEHRTAVWEAGLKKSRADAQPPDEEDQRADFFRRTRIAQYYTNSQSASVPLFRNAQGGWSSQPPGYKPEEDTSYNAQTSVTSSKLVEDEGRTTIAGGELTQPSHPWQEYLIAHAQASIRVEEDNFQAELARITGESVESAMMAELKAINEEISALQVNLLHTLLLPPFDGHITAVYKDVGENVEAGEPVCRLEDASWVLLAGRVQRPEAVFAGDRVRIACGRSFQNKASEAFEATVVSVRGHDAEDHEWDLLLSAANPRLGDKLMLPANGSLDPATTELEWR